MVASGTGRGFEGWERGHSGLWYPAQGSARVSYRKNRGRKRTQSFGAKRQRDAREPGCGSGQSSVKRDGKVRDHTESY
jgi:hypothetical protein